MPKGGIVERLRIEKTLCHATLTDCALVSGIPRWRAQQIFAGTPPAPNKEEIQALRRALAQLRRAWAKKRALLSNRKPAYRHRNAVTA